MMPSGITNGLRQMQKVTKNARLWDVSNPVPLQTVAKTISTKSPLITATIQRISGSLRSFQTERPIAKRLPIAVAKLKTYSSETAFKTDQLRHCQCYRWYYHDIGMLWGAGPFSDGHVLVRKPDSAWRSPVNRRIVFMTDGELDTGPTLFRLRR